MLRALLRAVMAALAAVGLLVVLGPLLPEPFDHRTLVIVLLSATVGHFLHDAFHILRAARTGGRSSNR